MCSKSVQCSLNIPKPKGQFDPPPIPFDPTDYGDGGEIEARHYENQAVSTANAAPASPVTPTHVTTRLSWNHPSRLPDAQPLGPWSFTSAEDHETPGEPGENLSVSLSHSGSGSSEAPITGNLFPSADDLENMLE